jgi:hypothetical protein
METTLAWKSITGAIAHSPTKHLRLFVVLALLIFINLACTIAATHYDDADDPCRSVRILHNPSFVVEDNPTSNFTQH